MPARNEEKNIGKLLKAYNKQTYALELLQVIVINDNSTDNTVGVINELKNKLNYRIDVIDLEKDVVNNSFKKKGITLGVQVALGDVIITNDADCFMAERWLETIISYYEHKRSKMIIGPVMFVKLDSFIKKFQAIDFFSMIGIAASSASNGFPQVCNGANLFFEKEAFFEVNGYEDVDDTPSGDDMFLMQKIYSRYPEAIHFVKSLDACVYTYPMPDIKSFFNQRIRWASKSTKLIDKRVTFILLIMLMFNLLLFVGFIVLLFNSTYLGLMLVFIGVKLFLDFLFLYQVSKFFKQSNLLSLFIPSQVCHILYIITVGILANFTHFEWKGRKIN